MQIESGRVLNQLAGKIKAVQKEIDQVSYRTVPYRCCLSMGMDWSEGYLYFQNLRLFHSLARAGDGGDGIDAERWRGEAHHGPHHHGPGGPKHMLF